MVSVNPYSRVLFEEARRYLYRDYPLQCLKAAGDMRDVRACVPAVEDLTKSLLSELNRCWDADRVKCQKEMVLRGQVASLTTSNRQAEAHSAELKEMLISFADSSAVRARELRRRADNAVMGKTEALDNFSQLQRQYKSLAHELTDSKVTVNKLHREFERKELIQLEEREELRRICTADVGEAVAKTAAVQRQLATLVSRFNAADTDRRTLQQEVDLLNVRNSSLLVAKDRMVDENQAAASRRTEAARKHCERVAAAAYEDGKADGKAEVLKEIGGHSEEKDVSWMSSTLRRAANETMCKMSPDDVPASVGLQQDGTFRRLFLGGWGTAVRKMPLAIKAVRRTGTEANERSIRNEIEALRHVQGHPYMIPFHGHVKNPQNACLFMDRAKMDLANVGQLALGNWRVNAWSVQMLSAVDHLKKLQMVHRDIKPENVFVSYGDKIVLADFGLARLLPNHDDTINDFEGTPGFLAPEVLQGRRYSYPVDVYGVGLVIFMLLHGTSPFWPGGKADFSDAAWNRDERENAARGRFAIRPRDDVMRSGCFGLILQMLETDPSRRLTAAEALRHPWVMNNCPVRQTQVAVSRALREYDMDCKEEIVERLRSLME